MRAEHLRQWLIATTRDNSPDATNWQKVVAILQTAFPEGTLAKECTWNTGVLITKGKRDLRGIRLVKFFWKAVASLLKIWLTESIIYHHTIHGFRAGRGTRISSLEAKLPQQLMARR